MKGAWPYSDPARLLAKRFGADAKTAITADGGNTPQSLVNRTCLDIQAGRHDVVLHVGAEGIYSRRRARRAGEWIAYTEQTDVEPDEFLGTNVSMTHPFEAERGVELPINFYPIFESAFRASRGETIGEHRDRISAMWETFNEAAVTNPYAWVRTPMTAAEIRDPTPDNRMVGFPYTKAMNSNWDLDQGAALILCSAEAAERLGVAKDRWVFPWAGTHGHDTEHVSNRDSLAESPAIRTAGRKVFELTDTGPDDMAYVDLYSCFPSAVQIGATELGLGLDRELTVTGGLCFAGRPVEQLRHALDRHDGRQAPR